MKDLRSRFGFHTMPFTREISVSECFNCEVFQEAIDGLGHILAERMSAALIGPAGTGKTTVLRAIIDRYLPEARYRVHYVKVSGLSKRDMCREIAMAAGCSPAGSYPLLVRNIQERFQNTCDTDGLRSVLIIDDAHDLRPDILGILRVLTNYDMDSRLVLSIILAGQLPLKEILRRDILDDVAKRLAHYATLRPLSRSETGEYIEHRCAVAGASSVPFDEKAIDTIYEIGRGNLRATDHLSRKSLHVAHKEKKNVADNNHVVLARKMLWP